jgi:excisionase family DNA binding protein
VELKPFVTFKEAARILRTGTLRLRRARDAGQIEAVMLGRRWAIPRSEILRLLNERDGAEK